MVDVPLDHVVILVFDVEFAVGDGDFVDYLVFGAELVTVELEFGRLD